MDMVVVLLRVFFFETSILASGARLGAEPDQGAADEAGRVEDGAQVQRDQLRECHQLTHRQAGRGEAFPNLTSNMVYNRY